MHKVYFQSKFESAVPTLRRRTGAFLEAWMKISGWELDVFFPTGGFLNLITGKGGVNVVTLQIDHFSVDRIIVYRF